MTTTALRLAAVLAFALSTSACSTIDSAVDDVLGPPSAPASDNSGFPPDAAAPTADAGTTPDLASVPDKPSGTTNPDAQREAADSLAADRARAGYSADALRGGTEAAAPPPGAAPEPGTAVADASPPPAQAMDNSAPPPAAPAPGAPPAVSDNAPPSAAPTTPVAALPSEAPPGAQPAVPANGGVPGSQPMVASNSSLGFKPSTAPALDPSISQFVAQPIIARYQQTAANAGISSAPMAAAGAPAVAPRGGRAMGGPEAMTGSVVANLDAIDAAPPSVYAGAGGMPPAAVVMFPGDGTALSAAGRAQVRAAVSAFQQRGGSGFIKVVGHSSSRTANMPVEKHLIAIFAKSQARAQAVANEIIREGVPASRVLVEAVGDSQPVYYESMPQGEDGNRRAEIFIQG